MLTVGKHTATVREHRLSSIAGKNVLKLDCDVDGHDAQVIVWLTDKSMGMARAQIRLLGFDIDKRDIEELHTDNFVLAGRNVPVLAEEYNGSIRCNILLNPEPTKAEMSDLTKQLRAAKRENEPEITQGDLPF